MKKLIEWFKKLFGGQPKETPAPAPAPKPPTVVEPAPKPEPTPAPVLEQTTVPSRTEMTKVLVGMIEGTVPTRVGPYKNIRETNGKNRSKAIDAIILAQGGSLGDPYCQWGQQEVLDELCRYYKINRRNVSIPEGGGTQDVWSRIPDTYKRKSANALCWVTWRHGNTGKGHVGMSFTEAVNGKFHTFEFNTTVRKDGGVVRDGEGASWADRKVAGDGDMVIRGFTDIYQAIADAIAKERPVKMVLG